MVASRWWPTPWLSSAMKVAFFPFLFFSSSSPSRDSIQTPPPTERSSSSKSASRTELLGAAVEYASSPSELEVCPARTVLPALLSFLSVSCLSRNRSSETYRGFRGDGRLIV